MEKILSGIKAKRKSLELLDMVKKGLAFDRVSYTPNENEMIVVVEFLNFFYYQHMETEKDICDIYILSEDEYKALSLPIINIMLLNDLKFGRF